MACLLAVRAVRVGVVALLIGAAGASGRADPPQPVIEEERQPAAAEPDEDYERLFPHYRKLLTPVDLSTPFVSLQGLADLIEERTGLSVELDRWELERLELSPDEQYGDGFILGRGKVPLHTYMQHALRRAGLDTVAKPGGLVITSRERVEEHLHIEIYPVADLFLSNHPTPPELLADPVFDAERAAEARIRANPKRPVTLDAVERPLADLLFDIAAQVDVPLVIDGRDMDDLGLDTGMPVTLQCRDLPGEEAFDRVLRPLHLQAYRLSAVVEIGHRVHPVDLAPRVRLHSVQGLVYECREPGSPSQPAGLRPEFDPAKGGRFFNVEAVGDPCGRAGGTATDAGEHSLGKEPPDALAAPGGEVPEATRPAREETAPADAKARTPEPDQESDSLAGEPRYRTDFNSLIRTITQMVAPHAWDEVGGPGSIVISPCTLDLLVYQASYIHGEIEELLDRLRRLPPVVGGHPAMRPARVPQVDHLTARELEGLRETLISHIAPQMWGDVGGPGLMTLDVPRGALIVSQTVDMHRRLRHFLTRLRRRRQEQLKQEDLAPDTGPEQVDGTTKHAKDTKGS
ncbi:MAG: hypothetical protein RBS80_00935 [Thermoguttaceae bacterium]|jgi:hypothetical protein|nr:hypothetical protein [Thermoguttaceae bacterium]